MTNILPSGPRAFIGCPGDADAWARKLETLYNGFSVPGGIHFWRVDFDAHAANAAEGSQYQILQTSHPDVDPVFILFANTIGTPLKRPAEGWGDWPQWLKDNGFGFIALLHEDGYRDADAVPNGKVPMTGTLYELLDVLRAQGRGVNTQLRIFRLPSGTPHDAAETARFARQGPWLDRFLDHIGQSCSIVCVDREDQFDEIATHVLRNALGLPQLDPRIDPFPGLEALSGRLGSLLFGRNDLILKLNTRLFVEGAPLTLIRGVSGAGKSSLLRAGLIESWFRPSPQGPGLRHGASAILFEPRPLVFATGADPLDSLMKFAAQPARSGEGAQSADRTLIGPFPAPFVRPDAPPLPVVSGDLNADLSALLDWWATAIAGGKGPLVLIVDQAEQIDAIANEEARRRSEALEDVPYAPYLSPAWLRFTGLLALLSGTADPATIAPALIARANTEIRRHRHVRVILGLHRMSALKLWPVANLPVETPVDPIHSQGEWQALIAGTFQAYGLGLDADLCDAMATEAARLADEIPHMADVPDGDVRDSTDHQKASVLPQVVTAMQRMMMRWHTLQSGTADPVRTLDASDYDDISHIDGAIDALGEDAWAAAKRELAATSGLSLSGLLGPQQVEDEQLRRLNRLLGGLIDPDGDGAELSYLAVDSDLARQEEILIRYLRKDRLITGVEGRYLRLPHRSILTYWQRAANWQEAVAPKLKLKAALKEEYHLSRRRPVRAEDWLVPQLDGYIRLAINWPGSGEGGDGELLAFLDQSLVELFDPKTSDIQISSAHGGLIFLAMAARREALAQALVVKGLNASAFTFEQMAHICEAACETGHANLLALLIQAVDEHNRSSLINNTNIEVSPLVRASAAGHNECTRLLLEAGADPNGASSRNVLPLLMAAQNGHAQCVHLLLRAGANPNYTSSENNAPLLMTAKNGHADCVSLLLNAGADPNYIHPGNGCAALLMAAQNGYTDCVSLLLENGANPNLPNPMGGQLPLVMAAQIGNGECVRLLLENGAAPNLGTPIKGVFPLLIAVENGHVDCVRQLLEAGAQVNRVNPNNGTFALLMAAQNGHANCISLLLVYEADHTIQARDGDSALLRAAQNGNSDCVRLLLKAGASPNYINLNSGTFPLLMAAENGHSECVAMLIDADADVNHPTAQNGTFPLLMAAQNGHTDCVELLLEAKALPNQINDINGNFPLLMAANNGHKDCVRLLLQHADHPNQVSPVTGTFPLLGATQDGHADCVKLLLNKGADPKQVNINDGTFPLLYAAAYGHTDCILFLLEAGAYAGQVETSRGSFPLLVAAQNGHADCARLLLNAGAPPDQSTPQEGLFPLLVAAQNGHADCARLLLNAGAPPDQSTPQEGLFPLIMAAQQGHADCMNALLAAGANPSRVVPDTGAFPLFMVALNGHADCARLLLAAGAAHDQVSSQTGAFPLLMAGLFNRQDVMAVLLEFGADANELKRPDIGDIVDRLRAIYAGERAEPEIMPPPESPAPIRDLPPSSIPGDWQVLSDPDKSHLPHGVEMIETCSLVLHKWLGRELLLWRCLAAAGLDEQTVGLLESYWLRIDNETTVPANNLPDTLNRLCNDGFRFSFREDAPRNTLAALALIAADVDRFPLAEAVSLPLQAGSPPLQPKWPETFSRPWKQLHTPMGPVVELPWIEDREWVVGRVLIPFDGRGVRVLSDRTVVASSDQWEIPRLMTDTDGQVYRLMGHLVDG